MAWTQTDIDRLEAAIAGGSVISSMTFGETTITFRSLDEMNAQLARMKRAVTGGSGTRYGAFSKGA